MHDAELTGFRRHLDRLLTPEERASVHRAAQNAYAAQRVGGTVDLREFCTRLLIDGLQLPETDAAAIVETAFARDVMPRSLRESMQ